MLVVVVVDGIELVIEPFDSMRLEGGWFILDDDDDNVNGVGSITEGPLFLFFDLTDVVTTSLHDNGEDR